VRQNECGSKLKAVIGEEKSYATHKIPPIEGYTGHSIF
jgi:hypothetical protein